MRNKYLRFADVLFLLSFVAGTTMTACSEQPYQPTLKATYNKPAKNWESEALPIGNGYMGAMIFVPFVVLLYLPADDRFNQFLHTGRRSGEIDRHLFDAAFPFSYLLDLDICFHTYFYFSI